MFSRLNYIYNHNYTSTGDQGRDQGLFIAPLYFNRAGYVLSDALYYPGSGGYFWSSTVSSSSFAYVLGFSSTLVNPANYSNRYNGWTVRCLARLVPRAQRAKKEVKQLIQFSILYLTLCLYYTLRAI